MGNIDLDAYRSAATSARSAPAIRPTYGPKRLAQKPHGPRLGAHLRLLLLRRLSYPIAWPHVRRHHDALPPFWCPQELGREAFHRIPLGLGELEGLTDSHAQA